VDRLFSDLARFWLCYSNGKSFPNTEELPMSQWQIFKHLAAIFGMALLLPQSLVWAAPQCSSVLSASVVVTQGDLDNTVQQLADMRLKLDLAQSTGRLSLVDKGLKQAFATKMNELQQILQFKLSETQIRDLISAKIRDLQGLRDQEVKTRAEGVEVLRQAMPYQLETQVAGGDAAMRNLTYVPKYDALFSLDHLGNLFRTDLKTGSHREVRKAGVEIESFKALADGTIAIVTEEGVSLYDPTSGTNKRIVDNYFSKRLIFSSKNFGEKVFSTDGEKVAIFSRRHTIAFLDTRTGKAAPWRFTKWSTGLFKSTQPTFLGVHFIGDSEVLIPGRLDQKLSLVRFNFKTGALSEIDMGSFAARSVALDSKSGTLFLAADHEIASIQIENLKNFLSDAKILPLEQIFSENVVLFGPIQHLPNNTLLVKVITSGRAKLSVLDSSFGVRQLIYDLHYHDPELKDMAADSAERRLSLEGAAVFDAGSGRVFQARTFMKNHYVDVFARPVQ
jgi:hypothetical protein